jgi:hypothetical protein
MNMNQTNALRRLIAIAKQDTGQCRRVANFLLSWFNGPVCGGWDVTDVWHLDTNIKDDVLIVLAFISERTIYPDTLGYYDDFQEIARLWRPQLFSVAQE